MDISSTENEIVSKKKFNLDEFDLESYDLNPLTSGLGFHHEEKKKVISQLNSEKAEILYRNRLVQASKNQSSKINHRETGLGAFYGNKVNSFKSNDLKTKKVKLRKKEFKEATRIDQFFAFIIDFLILVSSYVGILTVFVQVIGIPFEGEVIKNFLMEFKIYFISLYGMIFIFYFTLLDSFGTFGKRLKQVQLVHTASFDPPSLKQNILRAFISLMSIALLGLPFLANFQGRLSQTKLVKF